MEGGVLIDCHTTCQGYLYRAEKMRERNELIRQKKYEQGITHIIR